MSRRFFFKIIVLVIGLQFSACASFEPGMQYQDLLRPRQPTVKEQQAGLEVSIEEFATSAKSQQAFDADLAPHGILAILLKVENSGTQNYRVQADAVSVYLGDQILAAISGQKAAGEGATSEYAGKALGWTVLTGPFAILLWPATIAGSASHTAAVNRRIEQHFESMRFNDALLKPNQSAAGFVYFQLPSGTSKLEKLRVEVTPVEESNGDKKNFVLSLPAIDISSAGTSRATSPESTPTGPVN